MKFFDEAYCIHCNTYKNRLEELLNEFKRLNINVSIVNVDKCSNSDNPILDCSLNHVKIIENAYNKGLEHILIMEDDIRFLNDLNTLNEYIEKIPKDYDIILFDYVYGYDFDEISRFFDKDKTNYFINIHQDQRVFSAACYLLSRKGMEHIINSQKQKLREPDCYTTYKNNDTGILNRYVPRINLAIQKSFNDNLRTMVHGEDNTYLRYKFQGVNINKYNI